MKELQISQEINDVVVFERWFVRRDFNMNYGDTNLSLDHTNIATINPSEEAKLRRIIGKLKKHYEIRNEIKGFQNRTETLNKKCTELSKKVKTKIVIPIESKVTIRPVMSVHHNSFLSHPNLSIWVLIHLPNQANVPT